MYQRRQAQGSSSGCLNGLTVRILIGVVIVGFALASYFFAPKEHNDVTGEEQRVGLTKEQEIALGQQSAPELIREFGGEVPSDDIDDLGMDLVNNSIARTQDWEWDFHILNQPDVINAFALPGGQVFITTGLIDALGQGVDDERHTQRVAGVLAHEIVHVLARHSAQQMAKQNLANQLIGAVAVASGDATAAQTAAVVGQLITMKYGRDDETQSDTIGICLMIDAGYDPSAMEEVMAILAQASGGQSQPEFASTHPNPENRITKIREAIANADQECNFVNR